jgi:hypothetical protein
MISYSWHRGISRMALATAAVLCAQAAAAYETVFSDLLIRDDTNTGTVNTQVQRSSHKNHLARSAQGIRGSASSKANALGRAEVSATAYASEVGDRIYNSSATGAALVADVITIHLPTAGPNDHTEVAFHAKVSGESADMDPNAAGALVEGCIGAVDCTDLPAWVVVAAELPHSYGVVEPVGFAGFPAGPSFEQKWRRIPIIVSGPLAVVPVIYRTSVWVWGSTDAPNARASTHFQWGLKLPQGATCTSRSGVAFNGLCPAAASH